MSIKTALQGLICPDSISDLEGIARDPFISSDEMSRMVEAIQERYASAPEIVSSVQFSTGRIVKIYPIKIGVSISFANEHIRRAIELFGETQIFLFFNSLWENSFSDSARAHKVINEAVKFAELGTQIIHANIEGIQFEFKVQGPAPRTAHIEG